MRRGHSGVIACVVLTLAGATPSRSEDGNSPSLPELYAAGENAGDTGFWNDCGAGFSATVFERNGGQSTPRLTGFRLAIIEDKRTVRVNEPVKPTLLVNNYSDRAIRYALGDLGPHCVWSFDGSRVFNESDHGLWDGVVGKPLQPGATATYTIAYIWDKPGTYRRHFIVANGWISRKPTEAGPVKSEYGAQAPVGGYARTPDLGIVVTE